MTTRSIAIGTTPLRIGRDAQVELRIEDATVSRVHAMVSRGSGGLVVEDIGSRYGTFHNGQRVRKVTAKVGDRVQFGSLVVYRVTDVGLTLEELGGGMSLTAQHLQIRRGDRTLVQDVTFEIKAESFVGILGPSGAGKSTLLNTLASYLTPARGELYFDQGETVAEQLPKFRASLGHVPQEDIVVRALTVRENLAFAVRLRHGSKLQQVELDREVERALDLVGLKEHADKPTGVLSGGQRKRVSVAIELLKHPRLLLLDEPTSGLDPATEAHLMEQLRYIARQGRTVVCTTHLMENLRLFDTLIVLGVQHQVGRVAYVGPPESLLSHFQCQSFADLY